MSIATNASERAQPPGPAAGTKLSILVKHAPSASAPLKWAVYRSRQTLPHVLSRGEPYRKGVIHRAGTAPRIEVGAVPAGRYFVIVAQDLDGDDEIATFGEPRGYSGYDGCLIPDWGRGALPVAGPTTAVSVKLRCNNDGESGTSATHSGTPASPG